MVDEAVPAHSDQESTAISEAADRFGLGRLLRTYRAVDRTRAGSRLDLFENGLTVATPGGVRTARYDSTVAALSLRHATRAKVAWFTPYSVTDVHNETLELANGFENADEWGRTIQQGIVAAQIPVALETLGRRDRLNFGKLWMSATDVGKSGKAIPWSKVKTVKLENGQLVVESDTGILGFFFAPMEKVPNVYLCYQLAQRLREETVTGSPRAIDTPPAVPELPAGRGLNQLIFACAAVVFVIAMVVDAPTDRAEVCAALRALQQATGEISDELDDLRGTAADYRGERQDAIRSDAGRLGDLKQGSGWNWLSDNELNSATAEIRGLCGARSFS
ncbi:DUF6585 family protein [Nocardia otitidiscaviarum]|uniref:DUF6585 family protein n=1 Tax=Nocardia otitidiscaviarum TaxID=1823 RepID=UPI0024563B08|nr:DUF6585 family protein [Nocardia otitidiscaviarum]